MDTFSAYPTADLTVAHQASSERVHDAQARSQARAARAERRTEHRRERSAARQTPPKALLPWWVFRIIRPAH